MFAGMIFGLLLIGQAQEENQTELKESTSPIDPFSYTYNPSGKRDPFVSYLDRKTKVTEPQVTNPLLAYDLTEFDLKGVVYGMASPRAIITDGGGRGHIIRRGTRIGTNRGRVMRILRDRVVITERFRDPLGKLIVNEYQMQLNQDEDG